MTAPFEDGVLDLFRTLHPLDRVPRAGYLLRGVTEPESVAAHSHAVALLALLFLERYPNRWDPVKTLAMAVIHDLPEACLMDIPMPVADAHLGESKRNAEQAIAAALFKGLPSNGAAYHEEFSGAITEEARLLRGLDKAQMMIKVMAYEAEHRGCLDEFWINPANFRDYGVPEVSGLFEAICQRAGRPRPR